MTKELTAEELAHRAVLAWIEEQRYGGQAMSIFPPYPLEKHIVAAIRAAEQAATERAVVALDDVDPVYTMQHVVPGEPDAVGLAIDWRETKAAIVAKLRGGG